eukprot:6017919-Amphidinium_carterae.1
MEFDFSSAPAVVGTQDSEQLPPSVVQGSDRHGGSGEPHDENDDFAGGSGEPADDNDDFAGDM